MSPPEILEQLSELGVAAKSEGKKLVLRPGSKVPPDLLATIREAKAAIFKELERQAVERRIANQEALLEEWRRTSLPVWRDVLAQAIKAGDATREAYARAQLQAMGDSVP